MHIVVQLSHIIQKQSRQTSSWLKNDLVIDVIKDVCISINNDEIIFQWPYEETKALEKLGKKSIGKMSTFEEL